MCLDAGVLTKVLQIKKHDCKYNFWLEFFLLLTTHAPTHSKHLAEVTLPKGDSLLGAW